MRLLILAAGVALTVAGCGNNDQSDNTQNVDENLTAESIVSNDVTAIDAVTGDAANMAADVDINFTNDMLEPGGNATSPAAGGKAKPAVNTEPRPPSVAKSPPPAELSPAANATE
jgi:hypothetical protein